MDRRQASASAERRATVEPVGRGRHNAVIVKAEVRPGTKAPYINVEAVIHTEGDDYSRHVWGICSFSEQAQRMPGGPANLLQASKGIIGPMPDLDNEEVIAWLARAVQGVPILIDIDHEQVERGGKKQFLGDGSPEMKARIRSYEVAPAEFVQSIASSDDRYDS